MPYWTFPNPILLRRDAHSERVRSHLAKICRAIDSCANYGSHLASIEPREPSGLSYIVSTSILRNIVDISDSVSAVVMIGSTESACVLARSAYENIIGLQYMHEQDTGLRAKSFIYARKIKQIYMAESVIRRYQKKVGMLTDDEQEAVDIYSETASRARQDLKKTGYDSVRELIGSPELPHHSRPWYSYGGGPSDFMRLCEKYEHGDMYDSIYRYYSMKTHGMDSVGSIKAAGRTASMLGLRQPVDIEQPVFGLLSQMVLGAMRSYVVKWHSEYEFGRLLYWYAAHLRPAILRINDSPLSYKIPE